MGFGDNVLDVLPVAVYLCDADGLITRYNRVASELWGRAPKCNSSEDRFCGAYRLYWPDGRSLNKADTPMAEALRTGASFRQLEVLIERPDDSRLVVRVNIDPIRSPDGQIIGAVNCFEDITEQRQAELEAQRRDRFLRAVIDTTPECVKLVAADGALLEMNDAGLEMIEAGEAGEVLGANTLDLIAPECRDEWQANHARVCAGERLSWEFDLISLGGTRRHMETHAAPIQLPDGSFAQLAITRDVTKRKEDEIALRESEAQLTTLLQALPSAIYTTDEHGTITFYNRAAVETSGRVPQIGTDRWCIGWRLYWPDGTPLPFDECPMAIALKEDREIHGVEILAERPDGSRVPLLVYPTPLRDSNGKLVGAVNMLIDISERKQAEEHRLLLINELNHRVKNTLATVQSIAFHTLQRDGMRERQFEGRLLALARTHDVLTRRNWEYACLQELIETTIAPVGGADSGRFQLSGPDVALSPRAALSLAMALHELCTNAMKYGALSNDTGIVRLEWSINEDERSVRLDWQEQNGPSVEVATKKGFGSKLLERSLQREIGATVTLDYHPHGLACAITWPLTDD